MERVICLLIGYVFVLFQTGYIVGKIKHIDIRKQGSGNAGSTNAVRVMGWKAGAMTFAGDVLKCVLAVLLVRYLYRDTDMTLLLGMYAGFGATLGHNFPFYLKFKGGKGIAVLAGLVVSTGFLLVPVPLAAFLIAVIFTRYVSLGLFTCGNDVFSGNRFVRGTGESGSWREISTGTISACRCDHGACMDTAPGEYKAASCGRRNRFGSKKK